MLGVYQRALIGYILLLRHRRPEGMEGVRLDG